MNKSTKIENRGGVILIIVVALLAVMKLITSNLEEEIANANFKHVSQTGWYNAKSIKQVLKESERDYLVSLLSAGIIADSSSAEVRTKIAVTNNRIEKYENEKTEILLGSANIPSTKWSQDIDGELGKIEGINRSRELLVRYSRIVSRIDIGILFLQISIVFGILGLIINDNLRLQQVFTGLMIAVSFIGIGVCFYGYFLSF